MDEQKAVNVYIKISFSPKKMEIVTNFTAWLNLEDIMLNEVSQS